MILAPNNITTAELLSLTLSGSRQSFVVRTWNASIRKWQTVTDRELIRNSEQAAMEQGSAGLRSGDTAFLGEVNGTRVIVEVR